jgi:hypothetical protein
MPRKHEPSPGEAPRTDQAPEHKPSDEGYPGTDEEEEAVRAAVERGAAEDSAGGDREIE